MYIILFLLISSLTLCMESDEKFFEKKSNQICKAYEKNEEKLDTYIQECSNNPQKEIENIHITLMNFAEKIDRKYEALYKNLQLKYELDDTFQNIFRYLFQESKCLNNDVFQHQEQPLCTNQENKITHEENSRLIDLLKKNLTENNIPTHLINITYNNEDFIQVVTPIICCSKENPWHIKIKEQGTINIDKKIFEEISSRAQEGLCISIINELQHNINAALCHNIIEITLKHDIDEKEFDDLVEPFLTFSLFKIARKNSDNTDALKTYYTEIIEENFSVKAYKTLCKIDRLHTLLDWFEKQI